MAKGNFLTTVVRGKLGNMVGYKNTNSNNKETQAWRGYVATIKNPQSNGQARQRMIVSNIIKNYGALKPIIARGFEGVEYGGKSYQRFLKLNMVGAGNPPYVRKGYPTPVPGTYQISEGSLLPISVMSIDRLTQVEQPHYACHSDLYAPITPAGRYETLGEFSRALINGNTDIQAGDQLTFITVNETGEGQYIYRFASIIIDPESTEEFIGNEELGSSYNGINFNNGAGSSASDLFFDMVPAGTSDEVTVAGAVIQSRQGESGGWLRSTATLYCDVMNTNNSLRMFWETSAYEVALASYMSADSRSSDWPTEEDTALTSSWSKTGVHATYKVGETSVSGYYMAITDGVNSKRVITDVNEQRFLVNYDGSTSNVPASVLGANVATVLKSDLRAYGVTV